MAGDRQKREELLKFLDEKAFDPVLRATELNLPYLGQFREEFDQLCDRLGV